MRAATAAGRDRAVAAEEQNAPVAILDHRLDQRARQAERPVENHTSDQLPICVSRLGEQLVRPDRGIVDQEVDPAKLGQRSGGQRLDLGLFADIGENRDRLHPQFPSLTRDGLRLLLIGARVDHDMRPFAGQPQHSRTADIAPRSSDERDLAFELAHVAVSPTIVQSRYYSAAAFAGAAASRSTASAAAATRVPAKKRGFWRPNSRTTLANVKSRKSAALASPSSTISYASGTTSVMSGTSKWPMSELKIALSLAPNGLARALKAQTFDGSSASQPK